MSAATSALGPDDDGTAVPYSHPLIARSRDDTRLLWICCGIAVALHLAVLFGVVLPEVQPPVIADVPTTTPIQSTHLPPPPPPEPPKPTHQAVPARQLPVPDPDPDRPEPVREPQESLSDFDLRAPIALPLDIGQPDPVPASTPLDIGHPQLVPPVLLPETKVDPVYPQLAIVSRASGQVVLRAVIGKDGSVGEIEVLSCSRPGVGFEEAAVEAVRAWRYRPATLHGRPVDVYLAVHVSFALQ